MAYSDDSSNESKYSEVSYDLSSRDDESWDEVLIEGAEDKLYNTIIKLCQIENSNVTIEASNEYLRLEVAESEKFKKKYVDYLVKGLEKASSNLQVDYLGFVKEYLEEKRLIEQDHEAKDLISILINDDSVYNKAKEIILKKKKKATESLDTILIKSDERLSQFSKISTKYKDLLIPEDKRIELFEEAKNNLIEQFSSLSKQEQLDFINNQAEYKNFLISLNEDQLDAVKRGDKLVQAILSDSVLNEALTNIDQSSQKDPFLGVAKRGSGQSRSRRGSSHSRNSNLRQSVGRDSDSNRRRSSVYGSMSTMIAGSPVVQRDANFPPAIICRTSSIMSEASVLSTGSESGTSGNSSPLKSSHHSRVSLKSLPEHSKREDLPAIEKASSLNEYQTPNPGANSGNVATGYLEAIRKDRLNKSSSSYSRYS